MKKPVILLADDDEDILEFLSFSLEREGFEAHCAIDGPTALSIALDIVPDIILLDMMMPQWDGMETCRRLRAETRLKDTMIVFLTARSEDYMQIEGLDCGADDYISKPIKPKVLISRLKAILRRKTNATVTDSNTIELGNLAIDKDNYTVTTPFDTLTLPKKEFELLVFLVTHRERILTREEIFSAVWGEETIVGERTIDVHIRKLREKLQTDKIKTYKGIGYKYEQ